MVKSCLTLWPSPSDHVFSDPNFLYLSCLAEEHQSNLMSIPCSRGLDTGTQRTTQTHSPASTPATLPEITTLALWTLGRTTPGSIIILHSREARFDRTCPLLPPYPSEALASTPWTAAATATAAQSATRTERHDTQTQDRKVRWRQLFNLNMCFHLVYEVSRASTSVPTVMFFLTVCSILSHLDSQSFILESWHSVCRDNDPYVTHSHSNGPSICLWVCKINAGL